MSQGLQTAEIMIVSNPDPGNHFMQSNQTDKGTDRTKKTKNSFYTDESRPSRLIGLSLGSIMLNSTLVGLM